MKVSIIIPTMQKNLKIFNMLLDQLVLDDLIGEIIIIDNSTKGFDHKSEKIKVIVPKKNLYVNPAWNLGVSEAKFNYVGILNDDLIFPKNFFKKVYDFLISKENVGYIGLDTLPRFDEKDFIFYPNENELNFKFISKRVCSWGSSIFFEKKKYNKIPEKLKVWCGDDFLFDTSIKNGYENYTIENSNIMHVHSLTCDRKEFEKIKINDVLFYKKINPEYSLPKIHKVYNFLGFKIAINLVKKTKDTIENKFDLLDTNSVVEKLLISRNKKGE